ncbi:related to ubiquitin-protein ligase e3 component [Melanopsichium pennsylvanicum]|uniref:E3 ubiquitin-protein ligase n=2 Tax=Melanopsichium pennsylvanicum TaxID=63383 RepID=A0AAJ4XHM8_9BASI|nr:related to ubiquitin-protein ligase e3 component [Melanopsichium pennsylvanicum 4]SNX81368.1 related to ubiquitin-protein ligase e3 component [Melanopsichium pennsylvanicum]
MRRDSASRTSRSVKFGVCDLLSRLVPLPDHADPSTFLVTPEIKSTLYRNLFRHLLESVPSPAVLIPCEPSTSIQDALKLVESYDWNLSRAQIEEMREIALARKKGKQAQRAQSPWSTSSAYDDVEDPDLLGPEYSESRRGMPCGHLFQKGEAIYRCRECGLDDTCVQCAPCFQASIHAKDGHDVVFSVSSSSGGCCDCGDPEAWKQDIGCRYHSEAAATTDSAASTDMELEGDTQERQHPSSSSLSQLGGLSQASEAADGLEQIDEALDALPGQLREPLLDVISELITLIVTVFDHGPEIEVIPVLHTPDVVLRLPTLEEGIVSQRASRTPSKRKSNATEPHDSDEEMSAVEIESLVGDSIDEDDDGLEADRTAWGSRARRGSRSGPDGKVVAEGSSWRSAPRHHLLEYRPSTASENLLAASELLHASQAASSSASCRKSSGDEAKSQGARGAANGKRQFAVLLWNDEKHSFSQVIDIVTDATGRSEHEAKGVAERVDKHGREIIEVNSDLRRLYQIGRVLHSIDLAVTIRPAFDVFAEEVVQIVLNFLMDLSNCNLYLPSSQDATPSLSTMPPSSWLGQPLSPDAAAFKHIVARSLLAPFHPLKPIEAGFMSADFFDPRQLANYEGLLLMDCKLWKSARLEIKALLMSLIARREIKKELSLRFAKIYSKLVETLMLRDREQEYSICFLTVQLFSVPSIATMLVEKVGFLSKLLLLLQSIFVGSLANEKMDLILPPPTLVNSQASVHLMFLRQSRSYHIFYDIRYLLASDGVQKFIAKGGQGHTDYFLKCLSLFQAIHPSKRAVSAHVEFESEMWIPVFHISSHLGKAAKMFGEAFAHAAPAQLVEAMVGTVNAICWSTVKLSNADSDLYPPTVFHDAHYTIGAEAGAKTMPVIHYAVESQPVSFHHPMHWLLAELIRQIPIVGHEAMQRWSGKERLDDLLQSQVDEKNLLIALDYPLRVCVKLAQIRCNMWVRNGFVIRSQAHHYRDNSMRGIMYDQDLLLLQAGFALLDTDRFLLTMLDRFCLEPWFNHTDTPSDKPWDSVQGVFLAEEFLFLITTCLSELSSVCAWPIEAQIRREVIHFLALGQGTFSDVTKNIPEKLTDHAAFERILSQVSNFRAPDGTHDFGIFELKDECYAEIQPFFYHYTRNQREKVEEVLRIRQKKRLAQSSGRAVSAIKDEELPPLTPISQLTQLRGTLFGRLPEVLTNDVLISLVFKALDNTRALYTYAPDMLVDAALQIIMIGLVDAANSFADKAATLPISKLKADDDVDEFSNVEPSSESTLVEMLCRIELLEKFKPFKSKITWCLDKFASHNETAHKVVQSHFSATGRGVVSAGGAGATGSGVSKQKSAEEARRAAAKARQAAIMQKFSAQQKSLLDQLGAEDDDDDEDDEGEVDAATSSMGAEARAHKKSWGSCILCQENLGADKAFGSLAHIQPSRMIRMTPKQDAPSLQQALEAPLTMDRNGSDGRRVQGTAPLGRTGLAQNTKSGKQGPAYGSFPQEDHRFGFYASTCGHLMHLHCFETYCRSVEQRHTQQIARNHPEDLHRSEFICPLCKSLGNVILPVPDVAAARGADSGSAGSIFPSFDSIASDVTPLHDWIRKINIDILKHSSKTNVADYQETDHGSGAFLPFFVDHSQSSLQMRLEIANIDRSTAQMIDRLMNVLKPMSHATKAAREKFQQHTILAPQGRKMYIPEELVAYTIAMLEVSQRGMTPSPSTDCSVPLEQRCVADALNDSTVDLLKSLIHCLRLSTLTLHEGSKGPDIIRRGLLKRLLPHWGGDDAVRSPLLLRDPITILIEAAVVAPESLTQCTALMYYVCLVQTVFGLAQPSIWPQVYGHMGNLFGPSSAPRPGAGLKPRHVNKDDIEEARSIFPDVRWTVANIIGFVGYARGNITLGIDNLDDDTLAKMICSYTLPFLRRAAILRRVLGVSSPSVGTAYAMDVGEGAQGEYRRLLAQLQIPLPSFALPVRAEKQTTMASLVEGWIKHAYVPLASLFRPLPIQPAPLGNPVSGASGSERSSSALATASSGASGSASLASGALGRSSAGLLSLTSSYLQAAESHPTLLLEHPHIYELAKLPLDLATLLQDTRRRQCKKCNNVPPEPALCLLCGDVVCLQSFCCQSDDDEGKGECNQHMESCGGAMGAYFKIKSNLVLLLYQGNGTFHFLSPYLDSHGEIDVGLRKGRLQKLHQQRYDELRKQIWAHGVANIVVRKIESAMDQGGWQTF